MKLFLSSEAIHPDSIKYLKEVAGTFNGKKLVYIPTAANGVFYGSWKVSSSLQTAKELGAHFEILELESCVYQDVKVKLRDADFLWFAGGMSGYLLYWIYRTELEKYLPELLEQGTLYIGSSAGSMITAKTQTSSAWFLDDPEPGA